MGLIGASVGTAEEFEALSEIEECEIIQAPLSAVETAHVGDAYRKLINRGVGIFVRQIMEPRITGRHVSTSEVQARLRYAREFPGVTSVIVGVSTTTHLEPLIEIT